MRGVLHTMGTVVSVDIRGEGGTTDHVEAVFEWFRQVDERFSPWRPQSEVSRHARGELADADLSDDLREVLDVCEWLRVRSGGVFDIRAHRPDGAPDPTGLVKGWSVDRAVWMLEAWGATDLSVNAGGDVVVRGSAHVDPADPRWRIGIQHPVLRDRVAAVVHGTDLAVATSGTYERGQHIVDARTGAPPSGLSGMTVVGPELGLADAFATTAFAMGLDGLDWLRGFDGYAGCAITTDQRLVWTAGFERYRT